MKEEISCYAWTLFKYIKIRINYIYKLGLINSFGRDLYFSWEEVSFPFAWRGRVVNIGMVWARHEKIIPG